MKKYIFVIFSLLYTLQGVANDQKIWIIRGDDAFPPYEFINEKGEPDGFNIELTRAIMGELGLSYDLHLGNWPEVIQQFENGKVDLITGIIKFSERGDKYYFSQPHSQVEYTIVYRQESPINSPSELAGKKIIVQESAFPHEKLKALHYDNLFVVNNMDQGLQLLAEGKADAAICLNNMAKYIIYKNGLTTLDIANTTWNAREYCFAGHDPRLIEQINTVLVKLKANGTYEHIYNKWLEQTHVFHIPLWAYSIIGALLLTSFLLFFFVRIYKKKFKKGERLLKEENNHLNLLLLENKKLVKRYLTVLNTTLVGMSYYDNNGILVNINDIMVHFFGLGEKTQLLQSRLSIYQNPYLRAHGIIDELDQIHEFHGLLRYDMRKEVCPDYFARFSPEDKVYYYQMDVIPIKGTDGDLEGVLVTAIDQTSSEIHSKQMEEEEAKLDLVLEAGGLAAWIYDPEKKIFKSLRGNAIAGKGTSIEENFRLLHPDDRDSQWKVFEAIERGEKKIERMVVRYIHEDGTYHYYENYITAKTEAGKHLAILGTQKDVTEEILQRQQIMTLKEDLKLALKAGRLSALIYDVKADRFDDMWQDRQYASITGMNLEEARNEVYPDDQDYHKVAFGRILNNQSDRESITFRRLASNGKIHYYEGEMLAKRDRNGHLTHISCTRKEVTDRMEKQIQLEEYKIRFELAIEAGNIKPWIYDVHKDRFFNLQSGGMIPEAGISMAETQAWIHPDDRHKQAEIFQSILDGCRQKANCILRYINKKGRQHYFETQVMSIVDEKGKIINLIGTQKDVTKEMLHNKILNDTILQLRFAIQTAKMAIWEFDCATEYFKAYNEPIADYKDNTLILRQEYEKCFHPDSLLTEAYENVKNILHNGIDQSFSVDMKVKTKYDIDWQYCTIKGMPAERNEAGRVVKFIGIRQNNTELLQYQKKLEEEKEKAQQADKLKSAFLANMSHEIRTPLNAIVGFSELLQTTEEPGERAEYINIINTNNELLLRLIGDILDLSKIESGLIELKPELFDIAEVFDATYTALKQRCTNPNVEFIGRSPYKSCKVRLDKNRLIQVGTNFITNALKHTEQGHILMGYEYMDGGVRLYVEDTGCGIPEEKQARLFQRFAKLDDFSQGTGLGLAICKAIADAKHGKIGATTKEGEGSTFWAWFPCQAEIEEYNEEEEKRSFHTYSHASIQQKNLVDKITDKVILVAEDIDSNYLLVRAILKNYNLFRAKTGAEAVELATTYHYDAILMDMKMPVMNGIEATRKIREFDKDIPIIALTANAFDTDREAALDAGCNGFITKPFTQSDLEKWFGKN